MTTGDTPELIAVEAEARKLAKAQARRDGAIRAARAAGHSQRQIAEAAGLSHPTVATITRTDPGATR